MSVDVLVVGGGLAGSLVAWRLATRRPELSLCLVESGPRLGGNHTWSFHDTDLPAESLTWLSPLVAARWPRHEVRFPSGRRVLGGAYAAIPSERLHAVVAPALGPRLRLDARTAELRLHDVTLDTGETIHARVIIDARGGPPPQAVPVAWQTFLGQEIEFAAPHGLSYPILMDATVPQRGAFRFMYVLPWGPHTALVEDTAYQDGPAHDAARSRESIADYVERQGWRMRVVGREETGALPITLGGSGDAFWASEPPVPRAGVRAGCFHPTTGYSLPDAVRTAEIVARLDLADAAGVYQEMRRHARRAWQRGGYFRLLNRLLFRAAASPEQRYRMLEQFYQRPEPLISRFYAGQLSWLDRGRVLMGRPPVPLGRALRVLLRGDA